MHRLIILISFVLFLTGCGKYHKGDMFASAIPGDSLHYIIGAKGSGDKISRKAHNSKLLHEQKGNSCEITYLTDSVTLQNAKALMLINTALPEMKKDMLAKGFFGTFTSKQAVTILLVSAADFNKYFR